MYTYICPRPSQTVFTSCISIQLFCSSSMLFRLLLAKICFGEFFGIIENNNKKSVYSAICGDFSEIIERDNLHTS